MEQDDAGLPRGKGDIVLSGRRTENAAVAGGGMRNRRAVSSGKYGIIQGSERLAAELGVQIHRETEVKKILYTRNRKKQRIIEGIDTERNTDQVRLLFLMSMS